MEITVRLRFPIARLSVIALSLAANVSAATMVTASATCGSQRYSSGFCQFPNNGGGVTETASVVGATASDLGELDVSVFAGVSLPELAYGTIEATSESFLYPSGGSSGGI